MPAFINQVIIGNFLHFIKYIMEIAMTNLSIPENCFMTQFRWLFKKHFAFKFNKKNYC